HGWTRDDGVQHSVESCIDAVLRLAGGDVVTVDELQLALADVAELLRILESEGLARRDGLTRCSLRERSVPETTAGLAMHDLVVLRFDLVHRHLPALGRGRLEHRARRGAAAAHRLEEVTGAARAIGVLIAE